MSTNNSVNTSLSGQTGTVNFVGSTSPTLVTPVLGAASATSLIFSSTSGIIGTTTNNNAAAGSVGEVVTSNIPYASRANLTTGVAQNVTSISLTAGDWDVEGNVNFTPAAGTTISYTAGWISLTSATLPDNSLYAGTSQNGGVAGQFIIGVTVPLLRVSISGTTTVYLSAQSVFGVAANAVCGTITARRRR